MTMMAAKGCDKRRLPNGISAIHFIYFVMIVFYGIHAVVHSGLLAIGGYFYAFILWLSLVERDVTIARLRNLAEKAKQSATLSQPETSPPKSA